jgi:ribosomal protein S18 acetylase RimI-like enzyme
MERADVPFGMRLKEAAGWNQVAADWETFLALRPGGAFIARYAGADAGTAATIVYGGAVGWISMVLVDAPLRRRGIATRLLRAAVASLESAHCRAVKLDATALGKAVYDALGFREERRLARWRRGHAPAPAVARRSGRPVRPLDRADLVAAAQLDAHAFGAPRGEILWRWLAREPRLAHCIEEIEDNTAARRGLRGFVLGRGGSRCFHIGPLVAPDRESAATLLQAALDAVEWREAIVDAPQDDTRWLEYLRSLGFEKERELIRMVRGQDLPAREPQQLWAIAGPEFG